MAHQLQTMAYTGQTPWHNLGHALPAQQSTDTWAQAAGMDWEIRESPVRFITEQAGMLGTIKSFDDDGRVLLCSSFSKTLAPGLRIGWIAAFFPFFDVPGTFLGRTSAAGSWAT